MGGGGYLFTRMTFRITPLLAAALALGVAAAASAVSVTGADWIIHYNLPDQNTSVGSASAEEYCIRDALVARINALQAGQTSILATYSFSGSNVIAGGAGAILNAMSDALDRGATVKFVVDGDVNTNDMNGGTNSLASLGRRGVNPLVLVQDDSVSGIMHDKLGLFDYGPSNRWVFIASWNFSGAASSEQWNIALEARNEALHAAYLQEMEELLAGRFHDDPAKSHAHDGSGFSLAGSWGAGWVRFAPYPDGAAGGTNAQTDITNLIHQADEEIVFALNLVTRPLIQSQLVAAADRGVIIHGVIPQSAWYAPYSIYPYLTNSANYATTNIVHFVTPYSKADGSAYDSGQSDLVHEKWMIIDPWTPRPVVVHGSANWTDAALASTADNDENVVFIKHHEIARIFYAQFKRMTGMWTNRTDFWCDLDRTNGTWQVSLWTTDTNQFRIQQARYLTNSWSSWAQEVTGCVGRVVFTTNLTDSTGFFRAGRR